MPLSYMLLFYSLCFHTEILLVAHYAADVLLFCQGHMQYLNSSLDLFTTFMAFHN